MTLHPDMLRRMAGDLGLLSNHLGAVIKTAPLRYKTFYIPKRSGGLRQVAQPAREVKAIQRWIISELRQFLPIHPAVAAYEPGTSIQKNAILHAESRYLLKMDFTRFFPSILGPDIARHLDKHCAQQYTVEERDLIVKACTWLPKRLSPLQLCIGAPSSPFLSNSIMHEFDCLIAERVHRDEVTYTRYADDIVFSCKRPQVLSEYVGFVFETLEKLAYPKIAVNQQKTVHASRAGNRTVTGIVITPSGALSVGRERKRLARAMYHKSMQRPLTPDERDELAGVLAFIDGVEPGFSAKLKARYNPR